MSLQLTKPSRPDARIAQTLQEIDALSLFLRPDLAFAAWVALRTIARASERMATRNRK